MAEIDNVQILKQLADDIEGARIVKATVNQSPASFVLELEDKTERPVKIIISPQAVPAMVGNILAVNSALAFHFERQP